MALVNCSECQHEISDKAKACPSCGHALPRKGLPWYAWLLIVPVGGFCLLMVIGLLLPEPSPERLAAEKRACAEAMMSNINASTRNYTDKQAYDAEVRAKCAGLSIGGKPVAP